MFMYQGYYNLAPVPLIDLDRFRFTAKFDSACCLCDGDMYEGDTIHAFWFGERKPRYAHPECLNLKIRETLDGLGTSEKSNMRSTYDELWEKQRQAT